jgi:hypothetical protein
VTLGWLLAGLRGAWKTNGSVAAGDRLDDGAQWRDAKNATSMWEQDIAVSTISAIESGVARF